MTLDAQLSVLINSPRKYPDIARKVDLAMRHQDKSCIGEECDLDSPCIRHSRTTQVVNRYFRIRDGKN